MTNEMTGKYLITTSEFFIAPDGKEYKAVWGEVKISDDSLLGIKTNRGSTNWYAIVGQGDKQMVVAGCQIHYAIKCPSLPNTDPATSWNTNEKGINKYERPTMIYITE